MRIEAYNQVQQLYKAKKPTQVNKSAGTSLLISYRLAAWEETFRLLKQQ